MKILLIDIDSKIPNLALIKIARYYQSKGDEVYWNMPIIQADKIYVSCVYTKNRYMTKQWEGLATIGGSGYDLTTVLPPKIENIKLHINLGFTTRGCIRNCEFCIVPKKEGKIHIVGDLLDLWDGKAKDVKILDNNILALPKHFELICRQARENKIRVDFNQGLDHRLLTKEIAIILRKTPHKEYKFAFDQLSYLPKVDKALDILHNTGIKRCTWYVLVGFNTTFEEDLWRCNYLKTRNQNVYVQRYETVYKEAKYRLLGWWTGQHHLFQACTWDEFLWRSENRKEAFRAGLIKGKSGIGKSEIKNQKTIWE